MRRMPLFFKIWFGFIACLMVAGIGGGVAVVMNLADAGPEGIGRVVGTFARGFNETSR